MAIQLPSQELDQSFLPQERDPLLYTTTTMMTTDDMYHTHP